MTDIAYRNKRGLLVQEGQFIDSMCLADLNTHLMILTSTDQIQVCRKGVFAVFVAMAPKIRKRAKRKKE